MADDNVLVSIIFARVMHNKVMAAQEIADISQFRLNESSINNISTDVDDGSCTATVKCPSIEIAQKLVKAVNMSHRGSSRAKAFLPNSANIFKTILATTPVTETTQHDQKLYDQPRQTQTKSSDQTAKIRNEEIVSEYDVKAGKRERTSKEAVAEVNLNPAKSQSQSVHNKMSLAKGPGRKQAATVVSVSFEASVDKAGAVRYIKEITGFKLDESVVELDSISETETAYGVFVKCPSESHAKMLVSEFNRCSTTRSSTAELVSVPFDGISTCQLESEIAKKAVEALTAHEVKCKEIASKLAEHTEAVKYGSRGLALKEFDRKQAIIKPLQDKIQELLLQRYEFEKYIETVKCSIYTVTQEGRTKSELQRIKTDFERELARFTAALPMYAKKSDIVKLILNNQVSIILGETGSGKSTQILQYLHGSGLDQQGVIICTQPRKVAAISLAQRVAQEMRCAVGGLVGYRVGMQSAQTAQTKLLYVTDHMLLNDCLKDCNFTAYSCIVIDEAHERSIYTDLLLGFIKLALQTRKDLRVVVMSATIDPDLFVSYFSKCGMQKAPPVLRISGRAFPVDIFYQRDAGEKYVAEAATKALEVHRTEPPGDILVFLTNQIETEQGCKKVKIQGDSDIIPLELHGRLQIEDQQKVFDKTPPGKRKIIFATNSAETSITIPGIKYVIDTGKVREIHYDAKRNISELTVQWVTKSSAEQRKGRAGRTDCGKCFRLYSEQLYQDMRTDSVPEILRVHLGQALLKLMMLGIADATKFDFVEAPDKDTIACAQRVLRELEACDDKGITEIGKKLSKLPLEPRLGTVALKGIEDNIPFETVVIAAVSTVGGSIFFRAGTDEQKQLADCKKTKFCDEWGDIIALVNVYREWDNLPENARNRWCKENSINAKSMRTAKNMVAEIAFTFKTELGITVPQQFSTHVDTNEKMAKILFECYLSNLSHFSGHRNEGYCVAVSPEMNLHVHPSSALNYVDESPKWVVYEKVLTTSRPFMLNATYVKESWVQNCERINFSLDQLQSFLVKAEPAMYIGTRVIRHLLRDKAVMKKNLESTIKLLHPGGKLVLDILNPESCIGGTLTVFTTSCVRHHALEQLTSELATLKVIAQNETLEQPLNSSSVSFILAHGAQIRTIMQPHESRQVKVSRVLNVNDPDVVVITNLSRYGDIELVRKNDNSDNDDIWGFVHFKLPEQAAAAVMDRNALCDIMQLDLHVNKQRQARSQRDSDFTVKVVAQRRPHRGFGYVTFTDVNVVCSAVCQGLLEVSKNRNGTMTYGMISIQLDKKHPMQCYLKQVPLWADSEIIKKKLHDAFGACVDGANVNLPRAAPPSRSESDRLHALFQSHISSILLRNYFAAQDYHIIANPPRNDKDYDMKAFLKFADPSKARSAATALHDATFELGTLDASLELKMSFTIPKYIYNVNKEFLNSEIEELQSETREELSINSQECKNQLGRITVSISTTCLSDLVLAKYRLGNLLNGHIVKLEPHQLRFLKSAPGQHLINAFPTETETALRLDDWQVAAYIHGRLDKVKIAEQRLLDELQAAAGSVIKNVSLRSSCYPRGIMKALILKYGADLENLRAACGAASLNLVIHQHMVKLQGSPEACESFMKLLGEVASSIPVRKDERKDEENRPECPVCLTEVDGESYCVLEYCGHVYCKDCATNLIENAIRSNGIPIKCAADGCGEDLTIQDLQNIHGRDLRRINETSIRSFMQRNGTNGDYRYCITANCRMIYRRTPEGTEGLKFNCTECHSSICTSCNVPYHHGMTCSEYAHIKEVRQAHANGEHFDQQRWLGEDKINRAPCPKCGTGIEKNGGCQHMECGACHIHICWRCKQTFDNSGDCYSHLSAQHGSYM